MFLLTNMHDTDFPIIYKKYQYLNTWKQDKMPFNNRFISAIRLSFYLLNLTGTIISTTIFLLIISFSICILNCTNNISNQFMS